MSLIIELTPLEEQQLSQAAKRTGVAPEQLVRELLLAHLPSIPTHDADDLDAKLRKWQHEDATNLMPDVPTHSLFAQWAEEDSNMTEEERQEEDHLWEELESGVIESSRVLRLRRLG
jgi:hypothetical protein